MQVLAGFFHNLKKGVYFAGQKQYNIECTGALIVAGFKYAQFSARTRKASFWMKRFSVFIRP